MDTESPHCLDTSPFKESRNTLLERDKLLLLICFPMLILQALTVNFMADEKLLLPRYVNLTNRGAIATRRILQRSRFSLLRALESACTLAVGGAALKSSSSLQISVVSFTFQLAPVSPCCGYFS